jgi:hypothetical protein
LPPRKFEKIARYEEEFGITIDRKKSVREMADEGTPYDMDPATIKEAISEKWTGPVFLRDWQLPQGAFRKSGGPPT